VTATISNNQQQATTNKNNNTQGKEVKVTSTAVSASKEMAVTALISKQQ
jgi:hypothetical protein